MPIVTPINKTIIRTKKRDSKKNQTEEREKERTTVLTTVSRGLRSNHHLPLPAATDAATPATVKVREITRSTVQSTAVRLWVTAPFAPPDESAVVVPRGDDSLK
ncbi:Fungal transcriptional regulatory protein [Sesbania bispinosa]|nr:Fungal transcriptional regulatory protein [Sesbania bispinosa]